MTISKVFAIACTIAIGATSSAAFAASPLSPLLDVTQWLQNVGVDQIPLPHLTYNHPSVPEPATLAVWGILSGAGALVFGINRWRKRKSA